MGGGLTFSKFEGYPIRQDIGLSYALYECGKYYVYTGKVLKAFRGGGRLPSASLPGFDSVNSLL